MRREFHFQTGGEIHTVLLDWDGQGWTATVDGRQVRAAAAPGERGRLALEIDGRRALAHVASEGSLRWVHLEGSVHILERVSGRKPRRAVESAVAGPLSAAMPGRVLDVLVQEGASVTKGETLLLLEAMKMELRIAAPIDGIVRRVHVAAGQVVERGAALVEIGAA